MAMLVSDRKDDVSFSKSSNDGCVDEAQDVLELANLQSKASKRSNDMAKCKARGTKAFTCSIRSYSQV